MENKETNSNKICLFENCYCIYADMKQTEHGKCFNCTAPSDNFMPCNPANKIK